MGRAAVIASLDELDFLIASDIFYDVCTFLPLITTISAFFDKFPKLRFYFGYAEREFVVFHVFLIAIYNFEAVKPFRKDFFHRYNFVFIQCYVNCVVDIFTWSCLHDGIQKQYNNDYAYVILLQKENFANDLKIRTCLTEIKWA